MNRIALIGAGQLGSRHLQALVLVKHLISIQVIDSSIESLKIAEGRFKEVSADFKGQISFYTDISSLDKNIDIAIVATNSKVRRGVIEQLVAHSKVNNLILEKVLFVKTEDYAAVEKLLNDNKIKTWVNCPRRIFPFYQNLQKELSGVIHFNAVGNAWGMGCNGIHLLDLFAFFIKSNEIVLSNNLIDKRVIESKRAGYIEFTGTITGHANGHSFHITSFGNDISPLLITINTPTARYCIQEGSTSKVRVSKLENKWAWEEQLTNIVVDKLIEEGDCELTKYKESAALHLVFLTNLISFLREVNNDNSINECLVT